jgi:branched-chain amino acid transport system substrate-binding protein
MGGTQWAYDSPMYFPQQTEADDQYVAYVAAIADIALPQGKKNLGLLACTEAQACTDGGRVAKAAAEKVGLHMVYSGTMSLAQPDFTAECLNAHNSNAEIVLLYMDTNSVGRVAASCARQGYHPIFATAASIAADRQKEDPNLDGMIAGTLVFPWFETGKPAAEEYQAAMKKYGAGIPPGVPPATGWLAAKLFERAAANLPEPPTSEALLDGLWSIKGDDLGGLTRPLTFERDRPAPRENCWFDIVIRKRAWVSPDNFQRHCAS